MLKSRQLAYYYRHKEKILAKQKARYVPHPIVRQPKKSWEQRLAEEASIDKVCACCGKIFHSQWETTKFCKNPCKKMPHVKSEKVCRGCGKNFKQISNEVYCGKDCQELKRRTAEADRMKDPEYAAKVRRRRNLYCLKRRASDLEYSLLDRIRSSLHSSLKKQRQKKNTRTRELLGCDIPFLRTHLEGQFKSGMSWENMGRAGWHIDHIRPCASFDLSDKEQQKICFHWSNLQPLWEKENMSKGCKWDDENLMII